MRRRELTAVLRSITNLDAWSDPNSSIAVPYRSTARPVASWSVDGFSVVNPRATRHHTKNRAGYKSAKQTGCEIITRRCWLGCNARDGYGSCNARYLNPLHDAPPSYPYPYPYSKLSTEPCIIEAKRSHSHVYIFWLCASGAFRKIFLIPSSSSTILVGGRANIRRPNAVLQVSQRRRTFKETGDMIMKLMLIAGILGLTTVAAYAYCVFC
jgi:hypothetical protein